jgi:hypothetical protein
VGSLAEVSATALVLGNYLTIADAFYTAELEINPADDKILGIPE